MSASKNDERGKEQVPDRKEEGCCTPAEQQGCCSTSEKSTCCAPAAPSCGCK